jgi:hypothetical protein
MINKSTLEINCDTGTVTVISDPQDLSSMMDIEESKADLIAKILAMQSKELLVMSNQQLMNKFLDMMRVI